jgi:hypothetical protein
LLGYLKKRNVQNWLPGLALDMLRRAVPAASGPGPRHLLFAFCDHYEPLWADADAAHGRTRVQAWIDGYPRLARAFRDADGRHPRHSFFFPGEQYAPEYLAPLARFTRDGLGEVEVHLHHDDDTAENLRRSLLVFLDQLASHGLLARAGGKPRYAFIHGNWCLANSRRDGQKCGVNEELPLLFETGCYADFTFPSAPDESQPQRVNQIWWPIGDLAARRAYEAGEPARVGARRDDRILLISGPLTMTARWQRVPFRIENGNVCAADPATPARIRAWVSRHIHVDGRPEWLFVKVHTHGAPDDQAASLLGEGGRMLHEELTTRYNDGRRFVLHYVSAREMYNVALAAMDGKAGNPRDYFDYELPPPPVAAR